MKLIKATVADLTGQPNGRCSSIVLLGAGNCLDVDLIALSEMFQTIHLVDLDESAVHQAVTNSGVSPSQFLIHAPADIAEPLLSLTERDFRDTDDNREQAIQLLQQLASENVIADLPEADVVVSLCVFTQILDALQTLVTDRHRVFGHALKSVRIGHLRRMLGMLRPGGVAVFVTDVVSSDTAPQLKAATSDNISDLVKQLVNEKNFFSGTNPAVVLADLNLLSRLPNGADTVHTLDPWPWRMGDRTYAVYALRIQKRMPVQEETSASLS